MTRKPKPITKPGRNNPYITIVDTGLAIAVQNFMAELGLTIEETENHYGIVLDELYEMANMLALEIEKRTF